jgi:hypothetical protein
MGRQAMNEPKILSWSWNAAIARLTTPSGK